MNQVWFHNGSISKCPKCQAEAIELYNEKRRLEAYLGLLYIPLCHNGYNIAVALNVL